jgi:hypothetical protein
MTIDKLKDSWRPATASPADPIGKPAQSAVERMRFVRNLVDLANRNEANMDGTMEPVERIVAAGDVVFAVWQDPEEENGVGSLVVKGAKLLKEIVASQNPQAIRIDAVKCTCVEQAIAFRQVLGDRDHDA